MTRCDEGDVRLVCGNNNRTGQVEVCLDHIWRAISYENWGVEEATVTCRQLGLPTDGQQP